MKHKTTLEKAVELGISLKKIETFKGHGGGLGINADICLNGKPFAHAYDDAWGGEMDIKPLGNVVKDAKGEYNASPQLDKNREILKEIQDKLKAYPPYEAKLGEQRFTMTDGLDTLVNALVDDYVDKKEMKKLEKKGVVYKKDDTISVLGWKTTIPTMIKKFGSEQIITRLQKNVETLKKEGAEIINIEYLKGLGVKM